jgi:hypothetical protein
MKLTAKEQRELTAAELRTRELSDEVRLIVSAPPAFLRPQIEAVVKFVAAAFDIAAPAIKYFEPRRLDVRLGFVAKDRPGEVWVAVCDRNGCSLSALAMLEVAAHETLHAAGYESEEVVGALAVKAVRTWLHMRSIDVDTKAVVRHAAVPQQFQSHAMTGQFRSGHQPLGDTL